MAAMTLQDYAAEIGRLERLETGPIPEDGDGQPLYETPREMAAEYLSAIGRKIRGIAWSGPYQGWARELISRAVASADRIAREDGRLGGYASRVYGH